MKHGNIVSELQTDYHAEQETLLLRNTKVAAILSFTLYPTAILLDMLVYPDLLHEFLIIRIVFLATNALILYILFFGKHAKRYVRSLGIFWAISMNISFCMMIYAADGAASTYYAALNLAMLAAGVLLPWMFTETLFVSIVTLLMYLLTCYLHHVHVQPLSSASALVTNSYFIFLTGIISTTSSYFTTLARMNEFNLRHELGLRNEELEQLDKLKSNFFANVSHELRTPLTLILSPVQDLLKKTGEFNPDVNRMLIMVNDNALRLLRLVNNLLEVIKLEEGKTELKEEVVEINAFLAAMCDSVRNVAEQVNIKLIKKFHPAPLYVSLDSYALERVFLNLLSNAIKFSNEGDSISVSTEVEDELLRIDVSDTGIGITAEDIPFIFDRFHQADGTSTRKYQGTGIGLSLVRELTELMGGKITVNSEPGSGTSMVLYFPLYNKSVEDPRVLAERNDVLDDIHAAAESWFDTPRQEPEATDVQDAPGKPVVLIVDDEPDMRTYLVNLLHEDYQVLTASDGQAGLDLARQHLPAIMVLDLMLPVIDGTRVCRELKSSADTKHIKILMLTARIDEEAKITALSHGANDFLTKPFSQTEVKTRLHNMLITSELENNLVDRNTELQQTLEALQKTQSKLVQSEKLNALGTLTSGLLHEINNPLNFSLTALMTLINEPVASDDDTREVLEDINEGMQRIKTIVSDLHTFAYPADYEKQMPFNFSVAVDSAVKFTSSEMQGIELRRDLVDNDLVIGSQTHIVQVLINLLTNAVKAIRSKQDQSSGEILICTKSQNKYLEITIRDNGIGIESPVSKQIFDPFFTTNEIGEGMGLGLSICHTILENHDSEIHVKSEPGNWSEISFNLKLAEETVS